MQKTALTAPGKLAAATALFPRRWEVIGVWLLLVVAVVFGAVVEYRTAFLTQRKGDLEVFLRTAWAVRSGADIYDVTDSHGFHYLYPPLFAILLTPLADPPPGAPLSWSIPFPITAALWYVLNVLCVVVAVNWLATTLERGAMSDAPRGCRRWWALRLLPILACLPPIGHTLMRGQVGLILLLLIAGMIRALVQKRSLQAGLWLALAICIKVIPAFLLLYPLYRRDKRCLGGCALGLVVGILVIPAAVFGPARTLEYYREWNQVMIMPALANGQDRSRSEELLSMTATDSQSLVCTIHNTIYLDRERRPEQAGPATRLAHWLIGGLLTVMTVLAAGPREADDPLRVVLFIGLLTILMLLLSPVSHLHYFCLSVIVVAALLADRWRRSAVPVWSGGLICLLVVNAIANLLPQIPGLEVLRDVGVAMYAAVLLWIVGTLTLFQRGRAPIAAIDASARSLAA